MDVPSIHYRVIIHYVSSEDISTNKTVGFDKPYIEDCATVILNWANNYTILSAEIVTVYNGEVWHD